MLAGRRDALIRQRTRLINTSRGYAAEFGLIAAKGLNKVEPLLARIAADQDLPGLAKEHARTRRSSRRRRSERNCGPPPFTKDARHDLI
jgi:transposase